MVAKKDCNISFATYTVLAVLKTHPAQAYGGKLAKVLNVNRSTTSRILSRLEKAGAVKKLGRSSSNQYEITTTGLELLKVARRVLGNATSKGLFRWHNLLFRLPLVSERLESSSLQSKGFVARKRGVVAGFEARVGKSRVFYAGSSFLVFPDPIYAVSLSEAVEEGLRLAESTGRLLSKRFPAVELHDRVEVCRQQMALKGGLTKWIPEGFSFTGDRLIIDFSTGEAEIETYGKFSVDGMLNIAVFLDEIAKGNNPFTPQLRKEVL